jgi:PIN domain
MPDSLDQLAQNILGNPAPVLLLDTCSIIDIIRVPIRPTPRDLLGAAQKILDRAVRPQRRLWSIVNQQVVQEWDDNAAKVAGEVTATITRTEESARRLVATARYVAPSQSLSAFSLGGLELEGLLIARSRSLLDGSAVLDDDETCLQRALDRMRKGIAPSSKGKPEYKDCHIIEHFLELAGRLRSRGFSDQIIFVSSNTEDYGKGPGACPPLDAEFGAVQLQFVTDIAWAESQLPPT